LSRFADAVTQTALASVAGEQRARGKLISAADDPAGPVPGLFGLAMGKHGAFELNYSSDIDLSLFFDPDRLAPPWRPASRPSLSSTVWPRRRRPCCRSGRRTAMSSASI
jgi:hypothetical protein